MESRDYFPNNTEVDQLRLTDGDEKSNDNDAQCLKPTEAESSHGVTDTANNYVATNISSKRDDIFYNEEERLVFVKFVRNVEDSTKKAMKGTSPRPSSSLENFKKKSSNEKLTFTSRKPATKLVSQNKTISVKKGENLPKKSNEKAPTLEEKEPTTKLDNMKSELNLMLEQIDEELNANKSAPNEFNLEENTELLKENESNITVKELDSIPNKNEEEITLKQNEGLSNLASSKSDLNLKAGKVDGRLNNKTAQNDLKIKGDNNKEKKLPNNIMRKKDIAKSNILKEEKESAVCNEKCNKYNSKEVRSYIQSKRAERKSQMMEETKKKEAILDMQRKNLEKLREKASQVLKKSAAKVGDKDEEVKPKWQGPLGEDISEETPAPRHIFEPKAPPAKKTKSNVKTVPSKPSAETPSIENKLNEEIKSTFDSDPAPEQDKINSNENNEITMDKDKKNINLLSKPNAKLRISKNKFPVEDPKVKEALDKALAKQRLSNELENLRNTVGCQTRSSEIDWTSKFKTLESPSDPKLQPRRENDSRRNTFEVLHPSNIPVHQEHFSPFDNSHHKRQQSPSSSTDHLPVKKVCTNEAAVHQDSLEVALKKIQQQVLLSENDGKVPDLIRSLKPDAFNIMNTIKMKIITSNKRDKSAEKREWLRKKVVASLPSDDTDAPSIVSMEEDRSILPDPLRLSDLQLPISNRSTSIYGSLPCSSPSLNKSTDQSMVTSSSFGCNASPPPPLVVPKSVQRLKLKSSFSQSDLKYSPIPQLRRSKKPMQHESDMENSLSFTTNIRYGPRYSSSSSVHTEEKNVFNPKMQPQLHEREPQSPSRRVQIDQVLTSTGLMLQFHAELNRLDMFDKTLEQIIAAENVFNLPRHTCKTSCHMPMSLQQSSTSELPKSTDTTKSHLTCETVPSDGSTDTQRDKRFTSHIPRRTHDRRGQTVSKQLAHNSRSRRRHTASERLAIGSLGESRLDHLANGTRSAQTISEHLANGSRIGSGQTISERLANGSRSESAKISSEHLANRSPNGSGQTISEHLANGIRSGSMQTISEHFANGSRNGSGRTISEHLANGIQSGSIQTISEQLANGSRSESIQTISEHLANGSGSVQTISEHLANGSRSGSIQTISEHLANGSRSGSIQTISEHLANGSRSGSIQTISEHLANESLSGSAQTISEDLANISQNISEHFNSGSQSEPIISEKLSHDSCSQSEHTIPEQLNQDSGSQSGKTNPDNLEHLSVSGQYLLRKSKYGSQSDLLSITEHLTIESKYNRKPRLDQISLKSKYGSQNSLGESQFGGQNDKDHSTEHSMSRSRSLDIHQEPDHIAPVVPSQGIPHPTGGIPSIQDSSTPQDKFALQKMNLPINSIPFRATSISPKTAHFIQMLIEDAEFQRKQHELFYKAQEDILHANYKAALNELHLRFRSISSHSSKEEESAVRKVKEHHESTIANFKEVRDNVLSNWNKRIEDLHMEQYQLRKIFKNKSGLKLRSPDSSPKKLKPLRSASATSVVETTSSSESSVVTQSYDEKKRYDVEDKTMILNQKKLEKELIKRLQKKVLKIHELDKYEQLMKLGRSRRDKSTSPLESIITRDVACLVKEDNDSAPSEIVASSLHSVEEARATDLYNSESFESPESSETPRQPVMIHRPAVERKPFVTARFNKSKVLIKVPLSPRVQMRAKRNCSSGSDESLVLSHNETQSEQSDLEVKISALKEQKRQRYAELSRLQRELKRAQRDQMKATEDALIKQIAVYDSYIAQTKKQLEEVTATTAVKPQIKHPRVSDKFLPWNADVTNKTQKAEDQTKQQEHIASDIETNSMKSISEASSIENTILSSGHTHVTEKVSPISEVLSAQGSISTHNKNEEAEIISAVVTDESIVSQQSKTDSSIPTHIESENDVANESQWMDAEEFFNELGHPDTSSFINPVEKKVESKETLSSVSTEAVSEALTNTSSSVPDSSDNQTKLEVEGESQSPQSEDADDTSLVKECITSEPEHIGSMDSIVSEVPTHSATNSSISKEKDDLDGAVISPPHVPVSVKDSSISSISENGLNNSGKLNIDEGAAQEDNVSNESIPYSLNNSSLNNSEEIADECDDEPSPDENLESTKSDLIKVFVSNKNKTQDKEKELPQTSIINTDEMITESKIVDKPEDKQVSHKNKVDKITDEILKTLVNECLSERKTQHNALNNNKLVVAETNSTDLTQTELLSKNDQLAKEFSNDIVNKYIVEATEAVLKIMDSQKLIDGKNNKIDVNSNGLMSNQEDSTDMLKEHEKPSLATKPNLSTEEETNDGEVFWFDEDLHPVSLQTQLEAEELRRKQLQIEQEIKQLEQAQETIPSYYYVREIPNKPPPPYTPPGQTATQPKDQHDPVPKKREEVERLVSAAVQQLFVAYSSGEDLSTVQPSSQYFSSQTGNRVYKKFLFDLAKQIFVDLTSNVSNEKDIPPWEKTGSRIKYLVLPKLTEDFISNYILKKIRILFGFEMDSIKENLIIQWSRKKRDRVDELLVRESQEEEQEWTDYSSCVVAVKNSVTMGILDSLVGDTALAFSKAWKKKLEYCERNS